MWKIKFRMRLNIKSVIFVSVILCIIYGITDIKAQACSSDDIPSFSKHEVYVTPSPSVDPDKNREIARFKMQNTVRVTSKFETVNEKQNRTNYIAVELTDDNDLVISTTLEFDDYEFIERSTAFVVTIVLNCNTGLTSFYLDVILLEANNHEPKFTQDEYEFSVPLPLPKDFDITIFGSITATDDDLINNKITFTTNSPSFNVDTVNSEEPNVRESFALLITAHQLLQIDEPITIELIATDAGNPPRHTQVNVIVKTDTEAVFIQAPEFEKAIYVGALKDDLSMEPILLTIKTSTFSEGIDIFLSDYDQELFTYSDNQNGVFEISLKNHLTQEDIKGKSTFQFVVNAFVDSSINSGVGLTVVLVDIPQNSMTKQLIFEKSLYIASISQNKRLDFFNTIISVTEDSYEVGMIFHIEDGDSNFFELEQDQHRVTDLKLSNEFPTDELEKRTSFSFTIVATADRVVDGRTAVVIDVIPKTQILFEKRFYRGSLSKENTLIIDEIKITAESYQDNIQLELLNNDKNLFRLIRDNNSIKLDLNENINEEDLKNVASFQLEIQARLDDADDGFTAIFIEIFIKPDAPQFAQMIYRGSLTNSLELAVNDIEITEETYKDSITFELLEDEAGLFKIVQTRNLFKLQLNDDLTEEDVNGITSFELLLKASVPDGDDGFTVIIISTPPIPDAPQFTKSLYTASLDLELKLPTFDDIQLTDNELLKNVQITLEGDDSDLFKYDIGETSILIELEDDLTEQIVENKHVLQFEIVAILKENLIGRTAVVINIPTAECDILPKVFPAELYIGTITTDLEININPIELLSSSPANIRIVPSDFDENFFDVQLVSKQIIISRGEGWDETIIRDKLSLRFVIYAYDEELIVDKAVVVFEIQKEECPISITIFEEEFYTGVIDEHLEFRAPTIPVPESINPEIQFTLEKFDAALFVINKENNQLQINIKPELLSEEYIADKINLHFIIVAKLEDDVVDSTNFIVEITQAECKALPNIFSKSVFKGVLNSNLELVLDTIPLGIDATSDISYSLAEDDAELFQIDGNTLEGVRITLKDDLQPGDIDQKTNLHFVLEAREDNEKLVDRTVVVIDLPRDLCRQVPVFVKPLYNGFITTTLDDIDVEAIQLTPASNREGVSMILDTEFDSALFNLIPPENDEITLQLKDKLTEAQIENKKVLQVTILAVLDGAIIGTSSVVFEIPKAACSSGSKIFKTSIHKGAFTSDLNLQPLSVEYNEDPEIDFVIALEESHDYALFTLSYENGEISIALAELINPDTISDRSNIEIVIIATVGVDTIDRTIVVVDIPKEICKQVPIFEEPLHIGQVTDDLNKIIIGKISLAPSSILDSVNFYLQSDDRDLFKELSYEGDEIIIELKQTLTEDEIKDKLYLWSTILAEKDDVLIGSTVVALALPIKEIEVPHSINVFEKQLYRGQLLDDLITLDIETITLNDLEGLILQYKLEEWDHELFEIKDDGLDIKLSRQLSKIDVKGKVMLRFLIVAFEVGFEEIASKSAIVIEIPQIDWDVKIPNSLLVKQLKESEAHTNIMNTKLGNEDDDCSFTIFEVEPQSQQNLFKTSNDVLSSEPFDRENSIFSNMLVPQIKITLKLNCGIESSKIRNKRALEDSHFVALEDIPYSTDTTILSIIIEDINDNAPEFVYPSAEIQDLLLGYPESKLAERIVPQYLVQLHAADKDEGFNAKIRYILNDNEDFGIEPETGYIYPLKYALTTHNEISLVVKAIDQDGDGLETSLRIKVLRLETKHFAVLTIDNEHLENVNSIIENIHERSGLKLNTLRAAVISSSDDVSSQSQILPRQGVNLQTSLRMIVYAFDDQDNPLENEVIIRQLVGVSNIFVLESLEDVIGDGEPDCPETTIEPNPDPTTTPSPTCPPTDECDDECDNDNTVYIVVIAVLGVLLIACAIGTFLMWWFWIRPYKFTKRNSLSQGSESSAANLEKDFHYNNPTFTVPRVQSPNGTHNNSPSTAYEIDNELTEQPQKQYPELVGQSLLEILQADDIADDPFIESSAISTRNERVSVNSSVDKSPSPPRERKKSVVKFDENVTRIDILDNTLAEGKTNANC